MALPKAIQRQVDEAAAAEAAVAQQALAAEVVVTDASQLQPSNDPTNTNDSATPRAAENPPPAPAPADDWQQKYKSLQGMFAQKTGELQAQNKQYESQLTLMQRQIDALAQVKKQDEAKDKAAADPKDVENFGADLIEMVQRYAEKVFQSMATQFGGKATELDGRIAALEQQVTGVAHRTNTTLEQQFYATLNTLVPDWEQVNQDPRWLSWLSESDPVYGAARQAALDGAHQQMDVQRVASVFKAFKSAHPVKPQSSLANQVAPNGAAASSPTAPAARPILSSKFVEKFYNDVAKGKVYAGREAEVARIDAEINLAAHEGRIR